jgi:hypothetical protein
LLSQNTWEKQRKVLFWSMVTWLCCFQAWGEREYHGGEGVVGQSYSPHNSQKAERENGRKGLAWYSPQRPISKYLLPSTRCRLLTDHQIWTHKLMKPLMGSEPSWSNHFPKTHTCEHCCIGDQAFNTWDFGGPSRQNHTFSKFKNNSYS